MTDPNKSPSSELLVATAFALMAGIAINAWAYSTLWAWFVVAQASGIGLLVHFATFQTPAPSKVDADTDQSAVLWSLIKNFLFRGPVVVSVGWVLHWGMS